VITSRGNAPLFRKILKNELSMARLERTRKELPENGRMMAGSSRFRFFPSWVARELQKCSQLKVRNFKILSFRQVLGLLGSSASLQRDTKGPRRTLQDGLGTLDASWKTDPRKVHVGGGLLMNQCWICLRLEECFRMMGSMLGKSLVLGKTTQGGLMRGCGGDGFQFPFVFFEDPGKLCEKLGGKSRDVEEDAICILGVRGIRVSDASNHI